MAYVYRYIDLDKEEVIYVGKVTKDKDIGYDPLTNRHKQHQRDEWYRNNPDNIAMQYIDDLSPVDADILESWLISYYDTGQLVNKGKTGWGDSELDLSLCLEFQWQNYGNYQRTREEISKLVYSMVDRLINNSDGLRYDLSTSLRIFESEIRDLAKETMLRDRAQKLNGYTDYKRRKRSDDTCEKENIITKTLGYDPFKKLGNPFEQLKKEDETTNSKGGTNL